MRRCIQAKIFLALMCLAITACNKNPATAGRTDGPSNQATPTPNAKQNDPDRQTVLALLRGKRVREVKVVFDSSSPRNDIGMRKAYEELIQGDVIACEEEFARDRLDVWWYSHCKPGPNGGELQGAGFSTFVFTAGYKVPSEVTGVSRLDQSSAIADIVLSFEPSSPLYQKYRRIFDQFKNPMDPMATRVAEHLGNETARAHLRLYDDGWRVQSIQ